jgi:DUF1680 family protein
MKRLSVLIFFLTCILPVDAQVGSKIEYFHLHDVKLLNSPFSHAQDLDKQYLLELDADRLLAPFLRESGLTPKAESYTNWENTGLDGHIGGHYISALSLMYASTDDSQIKERLDYMIAELKRCQDANGNGYIGGVPGGKAIWNEIAAGNIRAGSFDLNGKWVPLYNIHKTYAGLRDAYLYAGNGEAKEMLVKMADWAIDLVANLSEEQIQDMLRSEHGGLNETFADVAAITGDKKYLKLAEQFSHQLILNPLLAHEDNLTGMHANTQIPKVLGYKRAADAGGNESWSDAARFFWETIIEHRSVCIGGNSVSEHFNPVNDFSRMIKHIEGPETCNTYNMLRLSKMLYQTSLDKKYIDYYERALYNHILSTQNPETGGFVYFTQMRPGHYRVYSQPQTGFWCCVGSGLENHAKYGEMIYAHTADELYVNLFIPSELSWKEKDIKVTQKTGFPDESKTTLIINTQKAKEFTLKLRNPDWVENGKRRVTVNGKEHAIRTNEEYVSISRKWMDDDAVEMEMPMHVSVEQLPDKSNYYSFMYGPVVLAAKTGTENLTGLFADDSRGGHIAHGRQIPLKDMPIVVSESDKLASLVEPVSDKPLTFTLSNLYSEKYPEEMELIPFFRLHESRYIIYWPQATADQVKDLQKRIEQEERERIKLDAITIDKIACGEQQPESDHFIQSENSYTGFEEDVHWREARGWFSYQLRNRGKANFLSLKLLKNNNLTDFEVFIDEQKLEKLSENDSREDFSYMNYSLPDNMRSKDSFIVKFIALPNTMTPKFVEIRILSESKRGDPYGRPEL